MSAEDKNIEISSKSIVIKGAYEDIRPAVRRSVKIVDSVLEVLENSVGLPADFLNHHLVHFRTRYRERIEETPPEKREVPPFRIGCAVLKEVAYAAEEPDIQRLFAELLGTSCNTDTQHLAHPGFPAVINQLLPFDAEVVRYLIKPDEDYQPSTHYYSLQHHFSSENNEQKSVQIRTSIDNLVRLGLIEWDIEGLSSFDAFELRPHNSPTYFSAFGSGTKIEVDELKRKVSDMTENFGKFSEKISSILEKIGDKVSLKPTAFGKQFVRACIPIDLGQSSTSETN